MCRIGGSFEAFLSRRLLKWAVLLTQRGAGGWEGWGGGWGWLRAGGAGGEGAHH